MDDGWGPDEPAVVWVGWWMERMTISGLPGSG